MQQINPNQRGISRPQAYRQLDLSGGIQSTTSRLLQKRNQLDNAKNAALNIRIGSAVRRPGYEQLGRTIQAGNDGLGLHIYKYGANNKVMVGINNSNNSQTTIQYLDTGDYWSVVPSTTIAPNTRLQPINFLDESYWVGHSPDTNTYMVPLNIDGTLTPSTTRNVYTMPRCKFLIEYGGSLYAVNCEVNGVKYPDRAYKSSAPTGAITFVQNDQVGLLQQLHFDSVKYMKTGGVIDIYSAGTNSKVVSALTIISVDKNQNKISFSPTQINVKDNDEIWVSGRKNQLSLLWNTDFPTPEQSDFLRVPPGSDETPDFTGVGKNNNRLFLFTKNSFQKWDGANLVTVSPNIGCVSHETIKNIGPWTFWLHTTGIWGYNDSSGQLQKISRPIQKYIDALSQTGIKKASAVVVGSVYKVAVGEISAFGSVTTSTSTSSTSTSSTSSSTSSTSTSSTSVSSTSSSTSNTQTTTSTSSTSTSSTSSSTSSTSSSISTSSTSTSMSTSSTTTQTTPSTKQVVRLIYDFDMNALWAEYHKREFRYQTTHTMNGYTKPYFLDETGRVFRDETGNLDNQDTIPFYIELGLQDVGSELKKEFKGSFVISENARLANVKVKVDDHEWQDVGQLDDVNKNIAFPPGMRGHEIKYQIAHNDAGDAPAIDGVITYFVPEELGYANL